MSTFLDDLGVWPCLIGGVAVGFTLATLAQRQSRPKELTLMYFDGRGLAELARQMLAVAGVDYEDKRYPLTVAPGDGPVYGRIQKEEMEKDAAAGVFDCNMGRLPILKADGAEVGGSKAIYRYIANTYGLMGNDKAEAALIDTVCGLVWDTTEAFGKMEDKTKWFEGDGTAMGDRGLQWFVKRMEKVVGDGFAVGGRPSMADAVIYSKLGEACTTKGLFGNTASEPMDDGAKVAEVLAQHAPKLAKIVANWENHPAMQAHLANRSKNTPWF